MKKILCVVTLCAVAFFCGCKTKLDPNGVYSGNQFLFDVDKSLVDSKDTLNAFVTWEYQNHDILVTTAPGAIKTANSIRLNAPLWFTNAYNLRSNYIYFLSNMPARAPEASNELQSASTLLSTQATATQTIKSHPR